MKFRQIPVLASLMLIALTRLKWIFFLPAKLAFGEAGYENVPAGSAMIVELEWIGSGK